MTLDTMLMANIWKTSFVLVLIISAVYGKYSPPKKRVCVIGAGAAGLIAAKHLSLYPGEFEPVVFERQSGVGGLWIYTDSTTVDEYGLPVHSSVYKYLRINFPKELEAFPDYPHFEGDQSMGSFVEHTQMLQYLRNYTEHYNLRRYVKLSTHVEKVSPLPGMRWMVATRDLITNTNMSIVCDAVLVGNGNNFKGVVPKLPGIESFPGRVIHSHIYRYPEEFANQTVVILGASFSGLDIAIEISRFATKVYLSHRHDRFAIELPMNVEQALGVVGAEDSELILSDDSRLKADAMVLCTGYEYDYPFLDKNSGIYVDGGKYVRSVYKHFINIEYPTMAILNLPSPGLPFIVPFPQVAYFIAVLQGKIKLPSRDEMLKDAALPPGVPKSKAHHMVEAAIPYYQELALASGAEPLSDLYVAASLALLPHLLGDPMNFRKKKLHVKSDGTVEVF